MREGAIRVLLVTSEGACGIAEHSAYLREAVRAADPSIDLYGNPELLDPAALRYAISAPPDIIHLNYHAALHSRWTPEVVRGLKVPVVITYHDTGVPNSAQCRALFVVADAFVVHEPAEDLLGAIYWRQGVPDWSASVVRYAGLGRPPERWEHPPFIGFKRHDDQPVLGTVGFPFPWKNYDLLASATARAGWALVLLAPTATPEDCARWQALNPHTLIRTDFVPRDAVVAYLAGCDATAFLYAGCNTGTSGAIRQGLAARKPVLANDCRQFRDLWLDPLASRALTSVEAHPQALVDALMEVPIQRVSPAVCAAAEQDSWADLGRRYADLYRTCVHRVSS
jgi:glycosyltransferase involved in cell wall biosynthesis